MIAPLLPCPRCERHVRSTETRCPFCQRDLAEDANVLPIAEVPQGRLGSLAIMTFRAAALGVALTACGSSDDDEDRAAAGRAGAQAAGAGGTRANPDDTGGSATGGRGAIDLGGATFGGSPADGGQVSIYRATPKG